MKALLRKSKKKLEHCLRLNVDGKNSKNMVAFTAGSWSCGTISAQPAKQVHHMLLLYISVKLIHVSCIETLRRFQVGI
jgi:hypothetical protein